MIERTTLTALTATPSLLEWWQMLNAECQRRVIRAAREGAIADREAA